MWVFLQHLQRLAPCESPSADAPDEEALPPVTIDLAMESGMLTYNLLVVFGYRLVFELVTSL